MTNAEILRAVSHGLKLNSLMINYHVILSACHFSNVHGNCKCYKGRFNPSVV